MKVLITGGSGFLGRFLQKALEEQNHEVLSLSSKDCDLTLSASLEKYDSISFDQIYHLAAWIQAGDFHFYHSGDIWTTNQLINSNLLKWWKEKQPQAKLIAMGTSCAYDPDYPLEESYYLKGAPHEGLYPYAMTKRMLYIGLQAMHKQYNLDYLYVIPSTLYGPYYHTDSRQLHFIFDLIRKIYQAKELGQSEPLWGDGYQKRELIYAEDFVNDLLALSMTQKNDLFNLGAGQEYTIREFARLICESLDYDPQKIEYDTTKFVGVKSKCLSIEKLEKILGPRKRTPLKEGLCETINWFIHHKVPSLNL